MSGLVERAAAFAANAHAGQVRKYTGEPYINHPAEVAALVSEAGLSPAAIAAAWLHDVVEDCGITIETIRDEFGPTVAQLVGEVTDVSKPSDGNRKVRKAMDCDHLALASADGQSIKLADLISNTRSIRERDPAFAKVYLREKQELLAVMIKGHPALFARACEAITP